MSAVNDASAGALRSDRRSHADADHKPAGIPSVESAVVTFAVLALVILLVTSVRGMPTVDDITERVEDGSGPGVAAGRRSTADAGNESTDSGTEGRFVTESVGGAASGDGPGAELDGGVGGPGAAAGTGVAGSAVGLSEAEAQACAAGQNGGATDTGVSDASIKLGATVVDSGIGSSFLGPVRYGMQAIQKKVNEAGGICGRELDLVLKDDGWDRQRGRTFLQNLVEDEKVFALAVVPSSEGLDAAAGWLDERGIPVVGADGMLASQYTHEWTWPVATSTLSIMHVIAKNAHDRGAREFSLVYDRRFRFGLEGAYAFNQAVKRLTGNDIPGYSDPFSSPRCEERFCGIVAGANNYNSEARVLSSACDSGLTGGGEPCDFNALLLEPSEAQTWYSSGGQPASTFQARGVGAGAAQPLFTREFAVNCQTKCDGLEVWTGFNPPIERFAALPAVKQYVNDIRAESSSADANNQFLEGGYLGMKLLVEAIRQTGPDVTRDRLKAVLDSITLDTGLTRPLNWSNTKFANSAAQGFRINYSGSFNGWTEITDGWIADPWVGEDVRTG